MKQNIRACILSLTQGCAVAVCLVELVRFKPLSAFVALGVAWLAMRMEEL